MGERETGRKKAVERMEESASLHPVILVHPGLSSESICDVHSIEGLDPGAFELEIFQRFGDDPVLVLHAQGVIHGKANQTVTFYRRMVIGADEAARCRQDGLMVERDVVRRAGDPPGLHVSLERTPALSVSELDRVLVSVILTDNGIEPGHLHQRKGGSCCRPRCLVGKWSERRIVSLPHLEPRRHDLRGGVELSPQVRGLDLAHSEVRPHVRPAVRAWKLTAEESPAVGPDLVDDFGASHAGGIVDDYGAALSARREDLRLVEAEAAEVEPRGRPL